MGRALVLGLPLLAACDVVLGLDRNVVPDAQMTCEQDHFDGLLSAKWDLNPSSGTIATIANERLEIPFDTTRAGNVDVNANVLRDLTGNLVQITLQAAQPTTLGLTTTFFAIGLDPKFAFIFSVFTSGFDRYLILIRRTDNVDAMPPSITYDPAAHRMWRFVHVTTTNKMQFWTSETGDNWTMRFETEVTFDITKLRIAMGTVSPGGGTAPPPAYAVYDDFELCRPQ